MEPDRVHIAVLAGGQSRRMGTNKALLKLAGQTLIERVLRAVEPLALPILIIGDPRTYGHLRFPVHPDRLPNLGPIGGLYTALTTASGPIMLLGCDQPFLTPNFLRYILGRRNPAHHNAIVPHTAEGSQPLCALYEPTCLRAIERAIEANKLSMRGLLRKLDPDEISMGHWRCYDECGLLFCNLNTPEEFDRVQKALQSTKKAPDRKARR